MIRFAILGSSSSGNAVLVQSEKACVLVDNGLSLKQLTQRLERFHLQPEDLSAVLVTHEHTDHVNGLGVLARRARVPVFMTTGCAESLPRQVGDIPTLSCFESGDTLCFGDLEAGSFAVSHDAADPVNFVFRNNGAKLGFATDLGHCSQLIRARLTGAQALILESNYCPDLLRRGPYPPQVQQRIRSRSGHLSNEDARTLLRELCHDALRLVVLAHISRDNNHPELACSVAREAVGALPVHIIAAPADEPSPLFEVLP